MKNACLSELFTHEANDQSNSQLVLEFLINEFSDKKQKTKSLNKNYIEHIETPTSQRPGQYYAKNAQIPAIYDMSRQVKICIIFLYTHLISSAESLT